MRFMGSDLALNHAASVVVDSTGEVIDYKFLIDKTFAAKNPKGIRLHLPKCFRDKADDRKKDSDLKDMWRLDFLSGWMYDTMAEFNPDFIGVEGYAYDASGRVHQAAELCGQYKLMAWQNEKPLRVCGIQSLKMWATGKGNATKEMVMDAAKDRVGDLFAQNNPPQIKSKNGLSKLNRQAEEDLSDAYWVSQMLWVEWRLRFGLMSLEDLTHDQRRVINRVTKSMPIGILARPWTYPEGVL